MISKHVATRAPCWTGEQAVNRADSAGNGPVSFEPITLRLTTKQADRVDRLTVERQAKTGKRATPARRDVLDRLLESGLELCEREAGLA